MTFFLRKNLFDKEILSNWRKKSLGTKKLNWKFYFKKEKKLFSFVLEKKGKPF